MPCPESDTLVEFLDDELALREFSIVQKHVAGCEWCRDEIELLALEAEILTEALRPESDTRALKRAVLDRIRLERRE